MKSIGITWTEIGIDFLQVRLRWLIQSGISPTILGIPITLKLLGAYHDGHIQFHYPRVFSYSFDTQNSSGGHNDWRYNEFRISEESHLIHEIEWWGPQPTARWIIESDDVEYQWLPLEDS